MIVMQVRTPRSADFSLKTERLGPLPLINYFLQRMGLAALLEKHGFAGGLFGVAGEDIESLSDDRLGRALDRLFEADRATLLTEVVLAVAKRFAVQLER